MTIERGRVVARAEQRDEIRIEHLVEAVISALEQRQAADTATDQTPTVISGEESAA